MTARTACGRGGSLPPRPAALPGDGPPQWFVLGPWLFDVAAAIQTGCIASDATFGALRVTLVRPGQQAETSGLGPPWAVMEAGAARLRLGHAVPGRVAVTRRPRRPPRCRGPTSVRLPNPALRTWAARSAGR